MYLEDVLTWMGDGASRGHRALLSAMQELPASDIQDDKVPGGARLDEWLGLIADFVWCIHTRAPLAEGVLVFLPTYLMLEAVHTALLTRQLTGGELGAAVALRVLHSSVDLADALLALRGAARDRRSVILASNVAESSVTIPGLAWVVDACLNNEVRWDPAARTSAARLVWATKSQLEQRAGRTGQVGLAP